MPTLVLYLFIPLPSDFAPDGLMTMLEEHQSDGKLRAVCALCHPLNMSFLHHGRPITFKLLRNTSRVPAMIGVFMPFQQYTVEHPPPNISLVGRGSDMS